MISALPGGDPVRLVMATKKARSSFLPGLWSPVSRRYRFAPVLAPAGQRQFFGLRRFARPSARVSETDRRACATMNLNRETNRADRPPML
jgi:hypothetical protein